MSSQRPGEEWILVAFTSNMMLEFKTSGVPHRPHGASKTTIQVPRHVYELIRLWRRSGGYAGMTLAEFLSRATGRGA